MVYALTVKSLLTDFFAFEFRFVCSIRVLSALACSNIFMLTLVGLNVYM